MNDWSISLNCMLSALSDITQSKGDIILRMLIGMVFIMCLMWLAAVIAGKLGKIMPNSRFFQNLQTADDENGVDESGEAESDGTENIQDTAD